MKSHVVTSGPMGARRFAAVVREELARRCARSPQYSLRAFAADLCTDHSTLSQLLRGKRRWSERAIRDVGARLGLDPEEVEGFVARELREVAGRDEDGAVEVVRGLTEDALAVLSSFEHEALLELTRLDAFRPDVRWIARVLDVPIDRVNVALQRLLRLGMLAMEDERTWTDRTGDATTVHAGVAYETVRRLADRVRRHALEARGAGEREYSSTVVAIDRERVAEALERLARFRRDLLELLARGERRDALYHLEIGFLPLTRERRDDEETRWDDR